MYAEGEAGAASYRVRHTDKRLDVAALDLSGTLDDVLRRVDDLAARVLRFVTKHAASGARRNRTPCPSSTGPGRSDSAALATIGHPPAYTLLMELLSVLGAFASILGFLYCVASIASRAIRLIIKRYIASHEPSCAIPREGVPFQVGFCALCGDRFLWLGFVTYTPGYWAERYPWTRYLSWMSRGLVKRVLAYGHIFHHCPHAFDDQLLASSQ